METIQLDNILDIANYKDTLLKFIHHKKLELSVVFKSKFENAKKLRELFAVVFECIDLDATWKPRLTLIIDELNNNAIEYGSQHDETNAITLKIQTTAKGMDIQIEVQDTGNGSKHKTADEMQALQLGESQKDFSKHNSIRGR